MSLYDAFISYSHAKDKPIAAALQSAVQKLGKPWYGRRVMARTARTEETRTVWQQMTKLYRYIAEHTDGVAAMSKSQIDRPVRAS
jgi:hypothetical protein